MSNPITLNDLLELSDALTVAIVIPLTPRLNTRLTFDPDDSAELDDVTRLYGEFLVKGIDARDYGVLTLELARPTARKTPGEAMA